MKQVVETTEAPAVGGETPAERQLAKAQAITHVGSWEWDATTNAVRWSDELYRIYGLAPRSCAITLETFLERLHPDDRERVSGEVAAALVGGLSFSYPERIVRPDGSVRHLETIGEAVRNGDGRVVGLIGTCRDVTDERKRDEQLRLYADVVQNIQIGLVVICVEDPDDIERLHFVTFNPAAERFAGGRLAHLVGRTTREVIPYAAGGRFETLVRDVARDGKVREASVYGSRDPANPTRSLSFKAFPLPGSCVGVALEDITARTLTLWMADAEQRIFEMIAEGEPLAAILTTLVLAIEKQSPPTRASMLLVDADGRHVRVIAAPSLPEEYNRAIDGQPIGPRAGSCGTAAFLGRPVIVTDIEQDALWDDYRDSASRAGLRACWSTPVISKDGRVLGTFALYYGEPRAPSERELTLIARATHIAGIAIERRQLEEQLVALSVHVESAREEERTGIAREIHDELGQALTGMKLELAWIGRRAAEPGELPHEALGQKVRDLSAMVDQIIGQVRRISSDLRPGVLDDLGLVAALEWQAQEFERRTGLMCVMQSNVADDERFDRAFSTALFRAFQETLTNVARHGEATHVDVSLERDAECLELRITDDGVGITPEAIASPESLGLLGIRERARRLGGSATVSRSPTGGTVVSVRVPLSRRAS
jgi:PAS domain S-box-containing protein